MGKYYMQGTWELEIIDRLNAATPGEWHIEVDVPIAGRDREKNWVYIKPTPEIAEERFLFAVCNVGRHDDSTVQADAALIANAPADLRMLLKLISDLREELAAADVTP